jgi:hypothetical protein
VTLEFDSRLPAATPRPVAFHLAAPVRELASTRAFYGGLLGCAEGRVSETGAEQWIDYDFFGHQLSLHVLPAACRASEAHDVDGDDVPVRHFGLVLAWDDWHALRDRLRAAGVTFRIEPHVRFVGKPGEQATLFLDDPSGNVLEFKSFQDPARLFAR